MSEPEMPKRRFWQIRLSTPPRLPQVICEPENPKRRWQIHLSTAIILSLSVGAIMLANSRWAPSRSFEAQGDTAVYENINSEVQGWPWPLRIRPADRLMADKYQYHSKVKGLMFLGKIANMIAAVLILGGIYNLSEWLIRRREGRKT